MQMIGHFWEKRNLYFIFSAPTPTSPNSSKVPVVGRRSRWTPGNELPDSLAKTGATLPFTHVLSPLAPIITKIRHTRYFGFFGGTSPSPSLPL